MKLATVLMYAFGVVMLMILTAWSFFSFYEKSLSAEFLFKILVIWGFFLCTVYFARESGKGEPMDFEEVLQRYGDNVEWEVLAQGLCSKERWTGLISETRSGAIYFVYFAEKDIPGFKGNMGKLDKYFHAQVILRDPKYKYGLFPIQVK